MSAANLPPDSALRPAAEASDDDCEASLPTQPWHAPPDLLGALGVLEAESEWEVFDFHDTIPAPPWLDEPSDAPEAPMLPAR